MNRYSVLTTETDTLSDQAEFSAIALRKAIQTLQPMLGQAVVNGIIYDLELYGLLLPNKHVKHTIDQIETALERIFGDAASFLMRQVTNALIEKKLTAEFVTNQTHDLGHNLAK